MISFGGTLRSQTHDNRKKNSKKRVRGAQVTQSETHKKRKSKPIPIDVTSPVSGAEQRRQATFTQAQQDLLLDLNTLRAVEEIESRCSMPLARLHKLIIQHVPITPANYHAVLAGLIEADLYYKVLVRRLMLQVCLVITILY